MPYRIASVYLFDTCTHKCAYCYLAESGRVLDASQIQPYNDPAIIDLMSNFFNSRTTEKEKWLALLTGGEPLLMPNLKQFSNQLGTNGNKVAIYTALLIGENHPSFKFLINDGGKVIKYLMVSFHPEAEKIEAEFFYRLRILKEAGHSIIFRLVGHPKRLHRLEELSSKCRELDIAFHPTALFSPNYPSSYTKDEMAALSRHLISKSQLIGLLGGINTTRVLCSAGSNGISIDMRTGDITPCISTHTPTIGNIYNNELTLFNQASPCPSPGIACICDVHFQQNFIKGAEDKIYFHEELKGFVEPKSAEVLGQELSKGKVDFSSAQPLIGQTKLVEFQSLDRAHVKTAYLSHKSYYEGAYRDNNHPTFKIRQTGQKPISTNTGTLE